MSVYEEPVWWGVIDRDAAIAEQFPSVDVVRRERIGGPADRAMREAHEAAKVARERGGYLERVIADERSADAFIARMEERTSEAEKRRRINALNKEARDAKRRLSWLLGMEEKALKETA